MTSLHEGPCSLLSGQLAAADQHCTSAYTSCRTIAQQTRADRHTLMFSATWPSSIQKLAAEFLCNPVKVTIGSQDLSASHSVTQVPCPALPHPALPCWLPMCITCYHAASVTVFVSVLFHLHHLLHTYLSASWWMRLDYKTCFLCNMFC